VLRQWPAVPWLPASLVVSRLPECGCYSEGCITRAITNWCIRSRDFANCLPTTIIVLAAEALKNANSVASAIKAVIEKTSLFAVALTTGAAGQPVLDLGVVHRPGGHRLEKRLKLRCAGCHCVFSFCVVCCFSNSYAL